MARTTKKETETKEVKETKVKAKTTTKAKTKKEENKEITINDIPQDLLAQLTAQISSQIMSSLQSNANAQTTTTISNDEVKKWNKADLNKIKDDVVNVRSIAGDVTFTNPRTGIKYKWYEEGDIEPLTIGDLLSMESNSKRFLHTPWLMIDDERVIEAFGLKSMYKVVSQVEDINSFLDGELDEIKEVVEKLPHDFKNEFRQKITKMILHNEIDSVSVVSSLKEMLDIRM